jgi:periplasmic divalent cation tolerance protein
MAVVVALCNCPSAQVAKVLARETVERRLAACVNVLSNVMSVYHWEGRVVSDVESTLVFKTLSERIPALKAFLDETHPYETPELIVLNVIDGLPAYLAWVAAESMPPPGDRL